MTGLDKRMAGAPACRASGSVSAPDDRPEPRDRTETLPWEPHDGDYAAERDRWWHADYSVGEDW